MVVTPEAVHQVVRFFAAWQKEGSAVRFAIANHSDVETDMNG
jgi:hypothetical protein